MAEVKSATLNDGRAFFFEEDVPDTGALRDIGIENLTGRIDFAQALNAIKGAAERMIADFAGLSRAPSEIGISFGIKLSTDVGAIIAKAGGEANFTVSLKWAKES